MAAAKRRLFSAFKLSRKLAFMTGGFLLLLGASGTAALIFAGSVVPSVGDTEETATRHCSTIYKSKFMRAGEKRLLAVVRAEDRRPDHRVETGLRLAKHLSETEHADLIIVQMADKNGPENRAELRGPTIGTEIVYSPNPNRSRATSKVWEVRYIDAEPTEFGFFFGKRKNLQPVEIDLTLKTIAEIGGCDGDIIETADASSAAGGSEISADDSHAASENGH